MFCTQTSIFSIVPSNWIRFEIKMQFIFLRKCSIYVEHLCLWSYFNSNRTVYANKVQCFDFDFLKYKDITRFYYSGKIWYSVPGSCQYLELCFGSFGVFLYIYLYRTKMSGSLYLNPFIKKKKNNSKSVLFYKI